MKKQHVNGYLVMIASAAEEVRRRCAQGVQGRFSIQEARDWSGPERGLAYQNPSLLFLDLALPHFGLAWF
jgi:hypothetical protein